MPYAQLLLFLAVAVASKPAYTDLHHSLNTARLLNPTAPCRTTCAARRTMSASAAAGCWTTARPTSPSSPRCTTPAASRAWSRWGVARVQTVLLLRLCVAYAGGMAKMYGAGCVARLEQVNFLYQLPWHRGHRRRHIIRRAAGSRRLLSLLRPALTAPPPAICPARLRRPPLRAAATLRRLRSWRPPSRAAASLKTR